LSIDDSPDLIREFPRRRTLAANAAWHRFC
jgi:hypothetical protein